MKSQKMENSRWLIVIFSLNQSLEHPSVSDWRDQLCCSGEQKEMEVFSHGGQNRKIKKGGQLLEWSRR